MTEPLKVLHLEVLHQMHVRACKQNGLRFDPNPVFTTHAATPTAHTGMQWCTVTNHAASKEAHTHTLSRNARDTLSRNERGTQTRTHTHTHARTHARTHTHTLQAMQTSKRHTHIQGMKEAHTRAHTLQAMQPLKRHTHILQGMKEAHIFKK